MKIPPPFYEPSKLVSAVKKKPCLSKLPHRVNNLDAGQQHF